MPTKHMYDRRIFCSNCDYAYKEETMFKKQFNNTVICLCRKCARELANDIRERYKEEPTNDGAENP